MSDAPLPDPEKIQGECRHDGRVRKEGKDPKGRQRWFCHECRKTVIHLNRQPPAFNPAPVAASGGRPIVAKIEKPSYQKLARFAEGREAKSAVMANWALNNLHKHPDDIDPDTVPSPGAVVFLEYGQGNLRDFMKDIVAALMPNKQYLDAQERFQDDGREHLDQIAAAERELQAASAEGAAEEPDLQEEDHPVGAGEQERQRGNLDRLRA